MEAALPELGWGARGPQDCPESQAIHSHLDPSQGPPRLGIRVPGRRAGSAAAAGGAEASAARGEGRPRQRGQRGRSLVTLGNRPDDTAPRPRTPWPPTRALVPGEETAVSPQQLRPRAPAGQLRWGMNG